MKKETSGIIREASPDQRLAAALGLTREEYEQLSHSGIRQTTDAEGEILNYYITVSPLNPDAILQKLKMDKMRTIYFEPDLFEFRDHYLV